LAALKFGLKVITIESENNIGIHTSSKIDIIENINVDHIFKKLNLPINGKSNSSKWHSPKHSFELRSEINDLFIKRGKDEDSFEKRVIEKAKDEGGELLTNCQPTEFICNKDKYVEKVIIKKNNEKVEIEPKFVIGADGVNSNVLKLSGLSKSEKKYGEFHAYGVVGNNFDIPTEMTHIFFDRDFAPGGYIFTVKNQENDCVLGLGLDPSLTNNTPEEHYKMLKSNSKIFNIIKNANIKGRFQGYGKLRYLKNHSVGNVMLVGDAGGFLDLFLGFGLKQAIITGFKAAKVCKNDIDGVAQKKPYLEYESSIIELKKEIKLSIFLRKTYRKINNEEIDTIVKILSDLQKDGITLDYLFKKENSLLLKHILKNGKNSMNIFLKSFPNIAEYLLKIQHL